MLDPGLGSILDKAYDVSPRVAIRPESFGALLYHFGTRRLSFLKDPLLLATIRALADAPDARAACVAAGVSQAQLPSYAKALNTLVTTDMLQERT